MIAIKKCEMVAFGSSVISWWLIYCRVYL